MAGTGLDSAVAACERAGTPHGSASRFPDVWALIGHRRRTPRHLGHSGHRYRFSSVLRLAIELTKDDYAKLERAAGLDIRVPDYMRRVALAVADYQEQPARVDEPERAEQTA